MMLLPDAKVSRLFVLVAVLAGAGCRDEVVPLDGSADLPHDGYVFGGSDDGSTLPACIGQTDCSACCTGRHESGALDFMAALQACACQPQVCKDACLNTLCGSGLILDAACRTCLDGARAAGGACYQAALDCTSTQGACGLFEDCIDSCPR
ncbi:MAG: hypothetical protein JWM53_5198 [bacterium]|nr:hypothetical protein [bacterium]